MADYAVKGGGGERSRRGEMNSSTVCVTGAGGFIASWLVKLLLSNGYKVNGTVRDPEGEKNAHLKKLDKASENLKLFKADLLDYESLLAAIQGCEGVFHVASPVPQPPVLNPESELMAPAVTGTMNVLKACFEARVKRVLVVSSVMAVMKNPNWPKDVVMNESCWTDIDYVRKIELWYSLSKTLAESVAWEYAEETDLNLLTVCPALVFGPMLQPTVNSTNSLLLSYIKGPPKPLENRLLHIVDVRDVADALLLVYENPEASGRYLCSPNPSNVRNVVNKLKIMYPFYKYQQDFVEVAPDSLMSSERLEKLGWKFRTLEEILSDAVEFFQQAGLLEKN